jgi:hypothetical protein
MASCRSERANSVDRQSIAAAGSGYLTGSTWYLPIVSYSVDYPPPNHSVQIARVWLEPFARFPKEGSFTVTHSMNSRRWNDAHEGDGGGGELDTDCHAAIFHTWWTIHSYRGRHPRPDASSLLVLGALASGSPSRRDSHCSRPTGGRHTQPALATPLLIHLLPSQSPCQAAFCTTVTIASRAML